MKKVDYILNGMDWSYKDFCYTNMATSWTDNRAERKKKRAKNKGNSGRK